MTSAVVAVLFTIASATAADVPKSDEMRHRALRFDGVDDVVNAGDVAALNGARFFTVEMWVRIDTFSAWRTFFCKFQDLGNRIQFQEYAQPGKIAVCINNNADMQNEGNQAYYFTPGAEVTIGDWFHLAMVFDGTLPEAQRLKLFINGMKRPLKKDGTAKGAIPAHIPTTEAPLLLGAEKPTGAYSYKGLMNEVRIWTVARSGKDIRNDMERTLAGNEPGLQVYYPMHIDSIQSDRLVDLSPNGNAGKLINFVLKDAFVDKEVAIPAVASVIGEVRPIGPDALSLNWKRGSGSAIAVFATDTETTLPQPETGTTYTADSVFGKGTRIGESHWFCVYNGHTDGIEVSALKPSTEYRFAVIDYNGSAGHERYLVDSTVTMRSVTTGIQPVPPEKKSQEIEFSLSGNMEVGRPPLKLEATSASGLPVAFASSDTMIAKIAEGQLHVRRPGSVTITASQAGDTIWEPAAEVTRTVTVTAVQQAAATEQDTAPLSGKSSWKKKRPVIIAAGGAVVAGIITGIILYVNHASSNDSDLSNDRPPGDPTAAGAGN